MTSIYQTIREATRAASELSQRTGSKSVQIVRSPSGNGWQLIAAPVDRKPGQGLETIKVICPWCRGSGNGRANLPCRDCGGIGHTIETRKVHDKNTGQPVGSRKYSFPKTPNRKAGHQGEILPSPTSFSRQPSRVAPDIETDDFEICGCGGYGCEGCDGRGYKYK